jgi:hypothetical protein
LCPGLAGDGILDGPKCKEFSSFGKICCGKKSRGKKKRLRMMVNGKLVPGEDLVFCLAKEILGIVKVI